MAKRGFTLMELIVAAVVSVIVLGGMFTLLTSMQGSQNLFGQQNYVAISTQALSKRIIDDANEAVGGVNDKGVYLLGEIPAQGTQFCFHQKPDADPNNDRWGCYWQDAVVAPATTAPVHRCVKRFTGVGAERGAQNSCDAGTDAFVAALPGAAFNAANPTFTKNIFIIKLTNALANKINAADKDYSVTASISPPGYSLQ